MAVNDKKVFLYVGKKGQYGTSTYPKYTDAQIKAFNADEFVITNCNYMGYLVEGHEQELKDHVTEVVNLAKQVIQCTGGKKFIWLGLPHPPEADYVMKGEEKQYSPIKMEDYKGYANRYLAEFIEPVQKKLKAMTTSSGYDYYYMYVQGFYMNDEHVARLHLSDGRTDLDFGVDFSYSNLLSHPQIKMYSMISDKLKTSAYGWKKFLWAPYAGRGGNFDTTYADIAYIANTTDIFDTVLLQPGVYLHSNKDVDLNADVIRNSMNMQEVRTRDDKGNTNNRVVAKRSSTKIGCQMEIDEKFIYNPTVYKATYNKTVDKLGGSNVTVPSDRHFSFYWGDDTSVMADLTQEVNKFFANLN